MGFTVRTTMTRGSVSSDPSETFARHWSVWVTGNWRVTFRFEENEAVNVNLVDCH